MNARFLPVAALPLVAALLLAACGSGDDTAYPRLLPLEIATAEPAIPAHAEDAAADPESVRAELEARAAAAEASRPPAPQAAGPLAGRAAALRDRADALRATSPGEDAGSDAATCPPGSADPGCVPD